LDGGGGGGGGLFGGGGGTGATNSGDGGGGGGGGSGFVPTGGTLTSGVQTGNGQVTVTFDPANGGCPTTVVAAFTG
jgi:hypothetical protein